MPEQKTTTRNQPSLIEMLAVCAGNAIGTLFIHGVAALWRRHRRAAR